MQSIDRHTLENNAVCLAKTAKRFNVPPLLTSPQTESFSGNIWPERLSVFPDQQSVERTSMNAWKNKSRVKATLRKKRVTIKTLGGDAWLEPNDRVVSSHC